MMTSHDIGIPVPLEIVYAMRTVEMNHDVDTIGTNDFSHEKKPIPTKAGGESNLGHINEPQTPSYFNTDQNFKIVNDIL